jgi:hypothetical protein
MFNRYNTARGVLKRYMANWTGQTTAPKTKIPGGFYAIVVKDTGDVWLSETNNWTTVIRRVMGRHPKQFGGELAKHIERGAELELWMLTQPHRFSAAELEGDLIDESLLLDRKEYSSKGAGRLFVVRHKGTNDYFLTTTRIADLADSTVIQRLLTRMQEDAATDTGHSNKKLAQFITDNSEDILKGINFTIDFVCNFDSTLDSITKKIQYQAEQKFGNCLNRD